MMKTILYTEKGKASYNPEAQKEIPDASSLKPGQVLIKVECAVINPSDIYMMQGNYNGTYEYPVTPGGEGSGTVIAYGGGIGAWTLMGKRVGFTRMAERGGKFSVGGSYAEYVVTNDYQCISLNNSATWEQGACSFVNPLTAIGLLDRCKARGARAVIQTGAASQLGRMIIKLFRENGIPLINVVRRNEQIKMLKEDYGADYVLNSESETFDKELYELSKKLNANVALECVSGELTGRIMQVLAVGGTCILYGQLSEQKVGPINPIILIFKHQTLESFLLPYWIAEQSLIGKMQMIRNSKRLVEDVTVAKSFGFHQFDEALEYYKNNMTGGKVFLKPSLTE